MHDEKVIFLSKLMKFLQSNCSILEFELFFRILRICFIEGDN